MEIFHSDCVFVLSSRPSQQFGHTYRNVTVPSTPPCCTHSESMSNGNTSFPMDAAQVVGLFIESVLYGNIYALQSFVRDLMLAGIFLVFFFSSLKALLWSKGCFKPFRQLNLKTLIIPLAVFTIASLDVSLHLRCILEEFVGPPAEKFNQMSRWIGVAKMGCYVAQTLIGDSILIFQVWTIYEQYWHSVSLPILFWFGTMVLGAIMIQIEATLDSPGHLLNARYLLPSMLCSTLATNVMTTSLIVYRIVKVRSIFGKGQLFNPSPMTNVTIVYIFCGLSYTIGIIIFLGLYLACNNGQYVVSTAIVQIIGIGQQLIVWAGSRV